MSEARHEISKLIFTCDQRNDAGDFDGVGELFAHGTIDVEGMEHAQAGSSEVAEGFRRATRTYPQGGARTHHISTNLIIEVDEDAGTATCQSHYVMYQATDELPLQPINAGRNFDRFERVDGTWVWKHRYITVLLSGNMQHHLVQSVTPFN